MFLSSRIPKLLVLAGMDRLDKELTIGQMQGVFPSVTFNCITLLLLVVPMSVYITGKFQLKVLGNVGHCVHEDAPGSHACHAGTIDWLIPSVLDETAHAIAGYLIRLHLLSAHQ
jgi:hypothetical protein